MLNKEVTIKDVVKAVLKGSEESEIIKWEIHKLVEVANELTKLFLDEDAGYSGYGTIISQDKDVSELLEPYNSKEERDGIINDAIRYYFEVIEEK